MKPRQVRPEQLHHLREELRTVRKRSLEASRRGDFQQMAKLTCRAANLNREITDAECQLMLIDA